MERRVGRITGQRKHSWVSPLMPALVVAALSQFGCSGLNLPVPHVALDSLDVGSDQDDVESAALYDADPVVRRKAVSLSLFLTQDMLEKIAMRDPNSDVRQQAASQITQQPRLRRISIASSDYGVQAVVAAKLTDESLLMKMAASGNGSLVREHALGRIQDQSFLATIATDRKTWQPLLAGVALVDGNSFDPNGW